MKEIKKKKNIAGRMLVSSILVGGLALGSFYAADYLRKKDNLIAEQAATIVEQNSTIDGLTLQRADLLESIAEKNTEIQNITNLKNSALAQLETRTAERDAEIELKNQALAEKAVALATLETRTGERDAEIELKNAALDEKATALAEVTRLNGVITSINEELAELESELADELLANSQNQELITSLQADISALNNLKAGLENDLAELEVHIPELENAIDQLEILIDSKNAEIVTLNNQVLDLEEQLTERENTITQKNNEIAGLNGQIEDLNTNITTLQSKVSSAENVINFITLPEYTDPIFWEEHHVEIAALNDYLTTYVSDIHYSLLINSVEVPFTGTYLKLTSYLTDGTNSITVRPYVVYNNVNYYGQTFSTSIDYIAPVYLQMSIAEALLAENGTLIELTGIVTGKYSSLTFENRYNTLYVADSTGEIVVYEIATNWSDVQIGDIITAKGDKTIYQNLNEIQHATIENSEEEIAAIERIEATTYADLISKIPQRISFTATVQSFLNDYEVVVSFDNTNLNIRLEDSRVLTSIFEVGKTYQINAHMHSKSSTKTFLVIQSLDDIVEVSLEQLVVPTPLSVNFATQELIIPAVANATGYRVVLNNSNGSTTTETVDTAASTFALANYNLENNSIIELFALGDGVTYADSEGVQYVLEYQRLATPEINLNGTLLTISNIDPIALAQGDVSFSLSIFPYFSNLKLSDLLNNSFDIAPLFLSQMEKDIYYQISLVTAGFGYYQNSLASSSVSLLYDFYVDSIKLAAPQILDFNEISMIANIHDVDENLEITKVVSFVVRNSNGEIFELGADFALEIENGSNQSFEIYSQREISLGQYQLGARIFSQNNPIYDASDWVFTEEYYNFEFKKVPPVEFSISEGIITFDENVLFSFWLDMRFFGTYNSVLESAIQIHSGFNLNTLNLEHGSYDVILGVHYNNAPGYAKMGAGSNIITIQIN